MKMRTVGLLKKYIFCFKTCFFSIKNTDSNPDKPGKQGFFNSPTVPILFLVIVIITGCSSKKAVVKQHLMTKEEADVAFKEDLKKLEEEDKAREIKERKETIEYYKWSEEKLKSSTKKELELESKKMLNGIPPEIGKEDEGEISDRDRSKDNLILDFNFILLKELIEREPNNKSYYEQMLKLLEKFGQKNLERVYRDKMEKQFGSQIDLAKNYFKKGEIYLNSNLEKAIEMFKKALEQKDIDFETRQMCYYYIGRREYSFITNVVEYSTKYIEGEMGRERFNYERKSFIEDALRDLFIVLNDQNKYNEIIYYWNKFQNFVNINLFIGCEISCRRDYIKALYYLKNFIKSNQEIKELLKVKYSWERYPTLLGEIYLYQARNYRGLKDIENAKKMFKESINEFNKYLDKYKNIDDQDQIESNNYYKEIIVVTKNELKMLK